MSTEIKFKLNGNDIQMEVEDHWTLLHLLREVIGLGGTKEGCGIGECGACTIVVGGQAVNACLMFAAQLDGRKVLTVEGLSGEAELHPIQQSFAKQHAVQCGFCTPGILMSTHALLEEKPNPKRAEIVKAVAGNLCRCTGYQSIIAGIEDAASSCQKNKNRD